MKPEAKERKMWFVLPTIVFSVAVCRYVMIVDPLAGPWPNYVQWGKVILATVVALFIGLLIDHWLAEKPGPTMPIQMARKPWRRR